MIIRKATRMLPWLTLAVVGCLHQAHATQTATNTCTPSSEDDGDVGRHKVITEISEAFTPNPNDPRYDRLDALVDQWLPMTCKLLDGRPKLNFLDWGFKRYYENRGGPEAYREAVTRLKAARPNASYTVIAEATYWIEYGGNARGTGYIGTVSADNYQLYLQRFQKAEDVLLNNKERGSILPGWYELTMTVQSRLGRPREVVDQVFLEGTKKFPNYLPLYIAKRNSQEPKWGGSWQAVDDTIRLAVKNTEATEGQSMYARLYFGVWENLSRRESFLVDTRVSWPKLERGFKDLIALYPNSLLPARMFLRLACHENKKQTYLENRKFLGKLRPEDHWIPACDNRLGYTAS